MSELKSGDLAELEKKNEMINGYPAHLVVAGKQREMENIAYFKVKEDVSAAEVPAGAVIRPTQRVRY
jgi:hypothetical protein